MIRWTRPEKTKADSSPSAEVKFESVESPPAPEYNITGQDFTRREHFRYSGPPIIDVHAHVTVTGKPFAPELTQAEHLLTVAEEFAVERVWSMCPPEDIPPLRERFGGRIGFNGPIAKNPDEPDDAAYRLLDRYVELGVGMIKFWAAPRGRNRGLFVDAPWRIESARRARAAGVRVIMVHVADPDAWFRTVYQDSKLHGNKLEQYSGLVRLLEMFPDLTWIAAHMGGDPEHPDHLESLLERYPHLYLDTSATKWQVREVSARRDEIRDLVCRRPDRFLFGSDLVTHSGLVGEHYTSRYWCQRTLWESSWEGLSPIDDPDWPARVGQVTPPLRGLSLPLEVLEQVYRGNALRILPE